MHKIKSIFILLVFVVSLLLMPIQKASAGWSGYGGGWGHHGGHHRHHGHHHHHDENETPWYAWLLGAGALYALFK